MRDDARQRDRKRVKAQFRTITTGADLLSLELRGEAIGNRSGLRNLPFVWLVACCLAIGGCSLVGFAYNRADWLALQYAQEYVQFESHQRAELEALLNRRLRDHRCTELPEYHQLLVEFESMLVDGLTARETEELLATVRELYEEAVRGTVPGIARVLLGLSPDQLEELARNLAEKNREFHARYVAADPETRHRQRVSRTVERIQHWTGELGDGQIGLIEQRLSSMESSASHRFDYRKRKQQEFLELLASGTDPPSLEAFLIYWWIIQSDLDEQTRISGEHRMARLSAMLADLETTLTGPQREKLQVTLSGYREVVTELMEGKGNVPMSSPGALRSHRR